MEDEVVMSLIVPGPSGRRRRIYSTLSNVQREQAVDDLFYLYLNHMKVDLKVDPSKYPCSDFWDMLKIEWNDLLLFC